MMPTIVMKHENDSWNDAAQPRLFADPLESRRDQPKGVQVRRHEARDYSGIAPNSLNLASLGALAIPACVIPDLLEVVLVNFSEVCRISEVDLI